MCKAAILKRVLLLFALTCPLLAQPMLLLTPNSGRAGTTVDVSINAPLDPAGQLRFEPAGLAVSNIRVSRTGAQFTLTIRPTAQPGPYTLIYKPPPGMRAVEESRHPNAFTVLPPQQAEGPVVREVLPPTVTAGAPAVELRISGANFQQGLRVDAGRGVNPIVTRVTPTLIVGTISAGKTTSPGPRQVIVTNPDGLSNARQPGQLTVIAGTQQPPAAQPPRARQVTPATITAGTMVPVIITGENFQQGLRIALGNGVTAAVKSVTPTQISAALAAEANATPGPRSVVVTNPDGLSDPTPPQITIVAGAPRPPETPRIDRITPSTFTAGTTTPVTLAGANFKTGATLTVGDGVTANVIALTPTQISATFVTAPNAAPGPRSVVVRNPDGANNANQPPPRITVEAPAPQLPRVRSVTPRTIAAGTTIPVTISGENFRPGAKVTFAGPGLRFTPGAINGNSIGGTLSADPNAPAGPRAVTVTNPDGASSPADPAASITVTTPDRPAEPPTQIPTKPPAQQPPPVKPINPVIVSITPPSVTPGQTNVNLSIIGSGFQQGANVNISGSGITLRNARVDSATAISATIDVARNAEAGPRGVVVRNPDGSSTAAQQPQPRILVVVATPEPPRPDPRLAPRVDLVTPRNIDPGAQVTLTLQGANFAPGMNISLGRDVLIVGAPVVRSPREATVTVLAAPAVSAGMRTVAASSAAGSSSGPGSVLISSAAPPAAAAPPKVTRPDRPAPIGLNPPLAKRPLPKGEIILDGPLDPESLRCPASSATECMPEVLTLDTVFTWHETNPGIADYFKLEIIDPYGKVLVSAQTKQRHYRMTSALMAALPLLDPGNVRKSGTPRRPKKNATGSGGLLAKGFTPPPLDRLGVSEEDRSSVKLVSSKPLMPGGGIGGLSAGMGAYLEEISVAAAWQDRPGVAYWRVIGYYDERDISGKRSGNFVPVEESSEEGILLPFPPTGAANCENAVSSANLKIDSRNLAKLPEQCNVPGQHCAGEDIMLSGTIDLSRVPFDIGSSMTSWPPKPVSAKRSGETIPSSVSFSNVFIDWGDGTEPERLSVASTAVASASSVALSRLATYDSARKGDIGLPLSHRYAKEAPPGGYTIRIYSVSDPDRVPTYKVADAGYKLGSAAAQRVSNREIEDARKILAGPSTHLIACTKVNVIDAPGASEQEGLHLIAAAVEWPAPYDATPEPKVSGCAEALRPRVRIDYWGQGRVRVSWLINGDTTPLEQTELTLTGVSKASGEARKLPRIEELGVSLPLSASSSANTLIARVEVIEEAKPAAAPAPSGGGKTSSPGGSSLYGSHLSGSLYSFAEVNTIVKAGMVSTKTVPPDFMARLRLEPIGGVTSSEGPREISSAPKSYSVVPPKSGEVCRLVYPTSLGDFVITDVTNLEEKAGRHSGRGTLRVDFPTGSGATKSEYVPISFTNWQLGAYKAGERRVENGTADVTLSTSVNPLNFDVKFTRIRLSREISTVDGTVSLTSAQLPSIPGAKYPSFPFAGIPMNPSGDLYFEYSTPIEVPLGFSGFNLRISKAAIDFSTAKGESSSATTCKETATGAAWTGVLVSGTLTAPDFSFGSAGKMLPDIPVEKWSFGPGGFSAELHRDLARNLSLAGGLAINVGKMDLVACNTSFDAKIGLKLTGVPLIEEPFSGEIQVTTSKGILAKFGGTAIKKDWTVVQLNIGRADFKYDSSIGDWAVSFDADATLKLPNGLEVYKHEFAGFKVTLDGKLASPGGSDWVAAGDTGPASLGGFPLQVTKIGAGLRAGGGVWFGISGAVQFASILKAEGSDIRFKLDRASGGGYRMAGVDVGELKINFSYPDGSPTVKAHATIGWQMEGSTYRFAGQGGLSIAGTIGVDAAFLYGRDPSVGSYWLARASVEFPAPIPFAPTPLGLFGVGGGIAYKVPLDSLQPHKKITDVRPSASAGYLFSATVKVGTHTDNGFVVYADGTLTIGTGVRFDVAAWLLTRDRGEPHAKGCIQYAGGSFDAGFGVNYKFAGDQIVVNAPTGSDACTTAAVSLHFGSDGWHVWLGNESNPINVKVLVFNGKGYLMADGGGIRTSVGASFHLRYSGDIAGLGGFVEVGGSSTVGLTLGLDPFVIGGKYGATVTGRAGVTALGKDFGIGINAGVDVAVSLPPFRACGNVHVSIDLGFDEIGTDVSACI